MTVDDVDRALVAGLRARDAPAFERLYARYRERIWAFLVRLTRDRAEAEDLFQETWASAARHAHALEAGSDVRAWLYAIARNKHRSARRFVLFDLRKREAYGVEPPADAVWPDAETERRRALRAVESALDAMKDAHREVLILCVVEGLDTAEVARVLAIEEDAVRKRLSRARAELAELVSLAEKRRPVDARKAVAT